MQYSAEVGLVLTKSQGPLNQCFQLRHRPGSLKYIFHDAPISSVNSRTLRRFCDHTDTILALPRARVDDQQLTEGPTSAKTSFTLQIWRITT